MLSDAENVRIPADGIELLADQAADLMELSDHGGLLQQEPGAIDRVGCLVEQLIEAWWVAQVRSLMMLAIGDHFRIGNAESVADAIKAQVTDWRRYKENRRWPEPAEVAAELLVQQKCIEVADVDADGGIIVMWRRFRRVEAARDVSPLGWIMTSELHRAPEDGPALIRHCANEEGVRVRVTEYHWQGEVHRPSCDGPALLETDAEGQVWFECYVEHGKRTRDPAAGPAHIRRDIIVGEIFTTHTYMKSDKPHRPAADGPAIIEIDNTGGMRSEGYWEDGQPHRPTAEGPARRVWDGDGCLMSESWFERGVLHRDKGPAEQTYNRDGTVSYRGYWQSGRLISEVHEATNDNGADGRIPSTLPECGADECRMVLRKTGEEVAHG